MPYRTFLFDLDGTLIDHFKAIHRCYSHTVTQFGRPAPTPAEVRAAVGGGLDHAMRKFFSPEELPAAKKIYLAYWDKTLLDDVELMPGAKELLESLHARQATLAVVTNKLGTSSRRICTHLGFDPFIQLVIGAGDTPWLKPAPELTRHLLEVLKADPATSLLVGDSPFDIQAAHQGGIPAWCVTTGTHSEEELLQAKADAVFPGLAALGLGLADR